MRGFVGVGVGFIEPTVDRKGACVPVFGVVEARGWEVTVLGESESGATSAGRVVARAACLCFSLVTPTATPTMTLMRMRTMSTMIAMPRFVLYQWYVYVGTGEGVSTALG